MKQSTHKTLIFSAALSVILFWLLWLIPIGRNLEEWKVYISVFIFVSQLLLATIITLANIEFKDKPDIFEKYDKQQKLLLFALSSFALILYLSLRNIIDFNGYILIFAFIILFIGLYIKFPKPPGLYTCSPRAVFGLVFSFILFMLMAVLDLSGIKFLGNILESIK